MSVKGLLEMKILQDVCKELIIVCFAHALNVSIPSPLNAFVRIYLIPLPPFVHVLHK